MIIFNMRQIDMSEVMLDWDRIIHKSVRSKDMQDAENVAALDTNSIIIILEAAKHECKMQKSFVANHL
jgi:hypothetical protein